MHRRRFLAAIVPLLPGALTGCTAGANESAEREAAPAFEVTKTEAEWRAILTPEQFRILRRHGTEAPGLSPLNHEHRTGIFHCAGCDLPLFSSAAKYDSRTGWPSFTAPIDDDAVGRSLDLSMLIPRTEVHCRRCGGHLGHVFDDGPPPTGKRYCINGAALVFRYASA
jgi:peptide-methionine (R)-S-oxide reductase